MITRYSVALNGVQLDALDDAIIITDIQYAAPSREVVSSRFAGGNGSLYERTRTNSASVIVQAEIHEHDTERRQQICEAVQAWAMQGGKLTTGDKPGRFLDVACETPPMIDSALKWTGKISMVFTAFSVPFWQDVNQLRANISCNGSTGLYAPGNASDAVVDVLLTNSGASAITRVDLTVGDTELHFLGLSVGAGQTLEIGRENGIMFARVDGSSVLDKRTAQSDDDLTIKPFGVRTLSVNTDGTASTVFKVRGMWL